MIINQNGDCAIGKGSKLFLKVSSSCFKLGRTEFLKPLINNGLGIREFWKQYCNTMIYKR